MTPDQRRNLPPQAQKQYSERPVAADDVRRLFIIQGYAEYERVALAVDALIRNLDVAEDTLALIAANGPVGVKMAVAKAQSEKPPPFPICDPAEWKQTATGERYYYALDRSELESAILAGLGFDNSYRIVHSIDGQLQRVWITKGDVNG